ncbi:hypothetical protein WA026_008940 [Henosepilachna vigintioctopunctata]|uniref:Site-specific DNA endonuclease n=1 Tax=Henosepilachna vigintioctopunctata TaxID=420089 RepID=A0AAW1VCN9_9CUCU
MEDAIRKNRIPQRMKAEEVKVRCLHKLTVHFQERGFGCDFYAYSKSSICRHCNEEPIQFLISNGKETIMGNYSKHLYIIHHKSATENRFPMSDGGKLPEGLFHSKTSATVSRQWNNWNVAKYTSRIGAIYDTKGYFDMKARFESSASVADIRSRYYSYVKSTWSMVRRVRQFFICFLMENPSGVDVFRSGYKFFIRWCGQ